MHAVVLTWNGAHLLPDCLRALRRQDARSRLHVVVVDNASSDGTAALLACDFPEVEYLRLPENVGYSRGNNEAMRRAPTPKRGSSPAPCSFSAKRWSTPPA